MADLTFEGGLNEQDDTQVDPRECTEGYNFLLGEINSHFRPRPAFDKKGTSVPNAGPIRGIIQLIKTDDTETTIIQAHDTVYNWDGENAYTSVGTVASTSLLRGATWSLGGYSVVTDLSKDTVVKKWDGAALTDLTTGLTSVSTYAKYSVVHLGRMWLFNVKAGSDTPHMMVASAFEDPESYDISARAEDTSFSTGDEAFFILTPNLKPINGVAKFYDTLIISTEDGLLYKLTGSDAYDFKLTPFYAGSAAIGNESISSMGNDVIFMRRGGVIESLSSTEKYGDVSADDLSVYIRNTTEDLTGGIFVYDQTRQRVYMFNGNNCVLALNKSMIGSGLSPWSVYKTNHSSSFTTLTAQYIRDPDGTDYHVYFGDDAGNIYHLDGTSNGDAGTQDIPIYRRSKEVPTLDSALVSVSGRLFYKRTADISVTMTFEWTDDYSRTSNTVPLDGPPTSDTASYWGGSYYWGGLFYWNAGFEFTKRISSKGFSPVGIGPSVYIELYAETDQNFDILKITDESQT